MKTLFEIITFYLNDFAKRSDSGPILGYFLNRNCYLLSFNSSVSLPDHVVNYLLSYLMKRNIINESFLKWILTYSCITELCLPRSIQLSIDDITHQKSKILCKIKLIDKDLRLLDIKLHDNYTIKSIGLLTNLEQLYIEGPTQNQELSFITTLSHITHLSLTGFGNSNNKFLIIEIFRLGFGQ